jgi:dihydrofolate synthase/folylpolyglutamate synthase
MYAQLPMYHRVGSVAYKKDLHNINLICEALGKPQDKLQCIHVAGTNGKGTVSHLIAFGLQQQGYKVGLYTSPHYIDFRERIKINGVYIDKKFILQFISKHKQLIEEIKPSFFEITVALAFAYFEAQKVDYCVIEVGLGGRLDSTNVITPLLSVITNISLDHTDMLGETLSAIAFEKAGIIKYNVPVLIGEKQEETTAVYTQVSNDLHAPLHFAEEMIAIKSLQKGALQIEYFKQKSFQIETELTAPYQIKNLCTFAAAMELLSEKIVLDINKIYSKMPSFASTVGYMGRWQILGSSPVIIADSAHNEGGLKYVFQKIRELNFDRLHIITGMVNDKKSALVLPLFPKEAIYYFAKANIPRGKPASLLQEEANAFGLSGKAYTTTAKAYAAARAKAGKDDLILVTGSIFTVAEILPKPKG